MPLKMEMQLVMLFVFLICEKFSLFRNQTRKRGFFLHKLKRYSERSKENPKIKITQNHKKTQKANKVKFKINKEKNNKTKRNP